MATNPKIKAIITADSSKFEAALSRADRATKKLSDGLALIARTTLVGVVAGFSASVVAGAKFERTIATVGGVSRATEAELREMTSVAREMGATTEWSATQAGDGLRYLTMAGFDASQSIQALPGVLDLATAGNIDLGLAADIASNALTSMRLETSELGRVNDVFIGTITSSNTDIVALAESFKYAGSVAAAYGYEIEQVSGLIGMLGNAGVQGSMAGTQLSAAFQDVGKVFDKYGESLYKSDGSTKNLIDAIKLLEDRGASATDIMEIFGDRAGRGVAALIGQGSSALIEYVDELRNSENAAKDLADTMRDTLQGDFNNLKSALESFGIDAYNIFSGNLRDRIQFATDGVRWLGEGLKKLPSFVNELDRSLKILDFDVFGYWASIIDSRLESFKKFKDLIKELPEIIGFMTGELLIKNEQISASFAMMQSFVSEKFNGLMFDAIEVADKIAYGFDVAGLTIKASFFIAFDQISEKMGEWANDLTSNLADIPLIGDKIADLGEKAKTSMQEASTATEDYAADIASLNERYDESSTALEKQREKFDEERQSIEKIREERDKNIAVIRETQEELLVTANIEKALSEEVEKAAAAKLDLGEKVAKAEERERGKAAAAEFEKVADRKRLHEEVTKKIKQLTLSEYDLKVEALDKEINDLLVFARDDKSLQDKIYKYRDIKLKKYLETSEKNLTKEEDIREKFSNKYNKLMLSDFDNKKQLLDEELREVEKLAENDMALQEQVSKYREEKLAEYASTSKKTNQEIEHWNRRLSDRSKDMIESMTEAFVKGESIKETVARQASNEIAKTAIENAQAGVSATIGSIVSVIQAFLSKGVAGVMGNEGSWQGAATSALKFLAQAGIGLVAAKKLGESVGHRDGGWLENHKSGYISQGSGRKDDVFLGVRDNIIHMGMGREFVVNPKSASKNRDLLDLINQKRDKVDINHLRRKEGGSLKRNPEREYVVNAESTRKNRALLETIDSKRSKIDIPALSLFGHADGGSIGEQAYELADDINHTAVQAFAEGWINTLSISGWYEGIKDALKYYGSVGAGLASAKSFNVAGLAEGGMIGDALGMGFGMEDMGLEALGLDSKKEMGIQENFLGGLLWWLGSSIFSYFVAKGNLGWLSALASLYNPWVGLAITAVDAIAPQIIGEEKWDDLTSWISAEKIGLGRLIYSVFGKGLFEKVLDKAIDPLNNILSPVIEAFITPSEGKAPELDSNIEKKLSGALLGSSGDIVKKTKDYVRAFGIDLAYGGSGSEAEREKLLAAKAKQAPQIYKDLQSKVAWQTAEGEIQLFGADKLKEEERKRLENYWSDKMFESPKESVKGEYTAPVHRMFMYGALTDIQRSFLVDYFRSDKSKGNQKLYEYFFLDSEKEREAFLRRTQLRDDRGGVSLGGEHLKFIDPEEDKRHLDVYHSGTPFVAETGPAWLQRGERILSNPDNRDIVDAVRSDKGSESLRDVLLSILRILKSMSSEQIRSNSLSSSDTVRVLNYLDNFDRVGIKQAT